MTKIDIVSGFLGAGKTTFIQKMLKEVLNKEKVVLIENEFGEIGIDGGFLKEAGIEIKEMNSGCICCSLVGDFGSSLKEVIKTYSPERILIEPSGVGKLSDVIKAVADLEAKENMTDVALNAAVVVVDVSKCKMYIKNFGEFFINQVEAAGTIILSRTQNVSEEKLNEAVALLREHNAKATIITTPWDQLTGEQILKTYEAGKSLEEELLEEMKKEMAHSHGEECDDPECECHHHHHDDDDDEDEHEHHHHHDDDDHDEHDEHEHRHDGHGHHHHHDHDHEGGEVEEYGIGTYVYYRRPAFDLGRFDEFVARKWPKNVIRAKGICYFDDEKQTCYVFEQAGKQVSLRNAGQWYATMPKNQLARFLQQNPGVMRDWDVKYGDRMQKLVFIGQHLDKKEIERLLDECLA